MLSLGFGRGLVVLSTDYIAGNLLCLLLQAYFTLTSGATASG